MADASDILRARIALAIGGREKALAVEKASGGRFKRQRLQSWIDGETSPPFAELEELAKFLGKRLSFFFPTGEEPSVVPVQKLDVRAAAGGGALNSVEKVEETLEFPRWMISRLVGNKSRLRLLRAHGDSMEPLIKSGALLLVDETDRDLTKIRKPSSPWQHTDIFVFSQGDDLRVKRFHVDRTGTVIMLSENPAYGPEILRKQDFKVHGRVVWWDNLL